MSITKSKYDCDNCGRTMGSEACKHCITSDDPFCIPTQWVAKNDMVNHPDHYQSKSGLETIDVIEAFCDGLNGLEAFCTGNAMKYLCRWKKKNGIEDLKKAQWYLNRLIEYVENPNKSKEPDIVLTPNDILIRGKSLMEFCKELEKESK
jgi:hypothetical protein